MIHLSINATAMSGIAEVRIVAIADLRIEHGVQTALGVIECGRAISGTGGRDDHVAPPGEPHRGVPEFDERKEAAFSLVERNAVVHDHERERAIADGPDHIGNRGQRDRDRPDFLLDGPTAGRSSAKAATASTRKTNDVDDENTQQISKHDVHPGFAEAGRGRLDESFPDETR